MNFLYKIAGSILLIGLSMQGVLGQEHSPLSFRIHMQPQVSSFNPIDRGFISQENLVSPSLAFGVEATKNLSKHLEISLGYHHSVQAGKYEIVWCDPSPENLFAPTNSRTVTIGGADCPLPREKVRFFKIPISLGWRMIEKKKIMSRLSFGPQLQISLDRSFIPASRYNRFSAACMLEWSNYFKLSKNFSLVAGLRADRSFTAINNANEDWANVNSFGLVMGIEYAIWKEAN